MTHYLLADVTVTDDAWIANYADHVHNIVHKHGGKYLARSANIETIEGEPTETTVFALLEFPTREAVDAFVNDPDYAPHAAARQAGTVSRFHVFDDSDVAGTIPYLPKGL